MVFTASPAYIESIRSITLKYWVMKKIDIQFDFRGRHHEALIRVFKKGPGREYHITVLDWNLERLLYGNEVIEEKDQVLHANVRPEKPDQAELKLIIAARLSNQLKVPCFTGNQCLAETPKEEGWEHLHPIPRHHY
jgi:hypothetical protein